MTKNLVPYPEQPSFAVSTSIDGLPSTAYRTLFLLFALALWACDEGSSKNADPPEDAGPVVDAAGPDNGCGDCAVECPGPDALPEGFVCVPAGEFWMGSPPEQIPRNIDEERHRVRITTPFLIATTEVTQTEWQSVVGNNPSLHSESGAGCPLEPCENRPVERINWHEAVAYANQRSQAEGLAPCYRLDGCQGELGEGCEGERRNCLAGYTCATIEVLDACTGYRLPTEAEWEHAARAGSDDWRYGAVDDIAWYLGTARLRTRPVGGLEPNSWGLHDVYGNVSEWTGDIYNDDYGFFGRAAVAIADPVGGEFGDTRVMRGGNWETGYEFCRAAHRDKDFPARRAAGVGLRLVRQLR